MDDIRIYLATRRDYFTGVALYEKHGTSSNLKRLLRIGGPTKGNMATLQYELGRLLDTPPVPDPAPDPVIPAAPALVPKSEVVIRRENTPEAEELKHQIISWLKIRDHLHATLSAETDQEALRQASLQILDLSDQITEGYERFEHFNKTGMVPPVSKKEQTSDSSSADPGSYKLFQRQSTLRTYITRYDKLVKSAKSLKDIEKNRRLLEKYTLELEQVNKQINGSV